MLLPPKAAEMGRAGNGYKFPRGLVNQAFGKLYSSFPWLPSTTGPWERRTEPALISNKALAFGDGIFPPQLSKVGKSLLKTQSYNFPR